MSSELISEIYATVTEPGRLVDLMGMLALRFGADAAFMFTSHSESEPEAILLAHNMDGAFVSDFAAYWHREDVWAEAAARRGMMRRDVVVLGDELLDPGSLHRSRFYNEFSRASGIDGMLGSVLFDGREARSDMPFTNLCWYRRPGRERFQQGQKRLLRRLLPHLQQAVLLQRQLQRVRLDGLLASSSVTGDTLASVVLDGRGRILARNAMADASLSGARPLLHCSGERLQALGEQSAPCFAEALAACRKLQQAVRLLVRQPGRQELLRATLCPLPADTLTHVGAFGQPCYILIIELPRQCEKELMAQLAELFRLTPAETGVLQALVGGLPAEQIAQLRGGSLATVRTQIRSILAKTGHERQIDLVRMVIRCAG